MTGPSPDDPASEKRDLLSKRSAREKKKGERGVRVTESEVVKGEQGNTVRKRKHGEKN